MITVAIKGDRMIIDGLGKYMEEFPKAVQRGLERSGKAIHRGAYLWLSGAGAKVKTTGTAVKENGKWKIKGRKDTKQSVASGNYPVPVRTGHLRRNLSWLKPDETKSNEYGSVTAGPLQVIIYNPAPYARAIHDGTHTQKKFGRRPFLTDAMEAFNKGMGVQKAIEDELQKARAKAGL
jgi:hypothetical protein